MLNKKLKLTWQAAGEHAGMKLREFLRGEKNISRKLLAEVKYEGGGLFINDEPAKVTAVIKAGDIVTVVLPAEAPSDNIVPVPFELKKIYEDYHLLVVDKPAYLPVLPMSDRFKPSLSGAVLHKYSKEGWPATVHIVTRLDRDTSGVMLIAKHRYAHSQLFAAQQRGEIKRTYAAMVEGSFPWLAASVHAGIGRKEGSIIEREVSRYGQRAVTHIKRLQKNEKHTHLDISLETGRTHQIRVHMSWLGYPLCGDSLYGQKGELHLRQALHAKEISFPHPIDGQTILCSSKVPF